MVSVGKNKQGLLILNTLAAIVPLCSPRLNVREERVAHAHLLGALFTVCQQAEWPRKGDWLPRKKKEKFKSSPPESCSTGLSLRQRTKWQAGLLSHAVSFVILWHSLIPWYSFSLATKLCSDVNGARCEPCALTHAVVGTVPQLL